MVCWFGKLRNMARYNLKDVVHFGRFIFLVCSIVSRCAFVTNVCVVGTPALIPQLPWLVMLPLIVLSP